MEHPFLVKYLLHLKYPSGEVPLSRLAPLLIKRFRSSDFASKIAKMLGEVFGVRFLLNALKDEDIAVQADVGRALDEMGTAAVAPLIRALKDESVVVSVRAEIVLKRMGTAAVEPLIAVLKAEDADVRKTAAQTLGEIKDPRAVEPLIIALKDEVPYVRRTAAEALQKITGQSLGEDYEAWLKWWQEHKK
jgi:HEAT repeat protein